MTFDQCNYKLLLACFSKYFTHLREQNNNNKLTSDNNRQDNKILYCNQRNYNSRNILIVEQRIIVVF